MPPRSTDGGESDRDRITTLEGYIKETRDVLVAMNDTLEKFVSGPRSPAELQRAHNRSTSVEKFSDSSQRNVSGSLPKNNPPRDPTAMPGANSALLDLQQLVKWVEASVAIQKTARGYLTRRSNQALQQPVPLAPSSLRSPTRLGNVKTREVSFGDSPSSSGVDSSADGSMRGLNRDVRVSFQGELLRPGSSKAIDCVSTDNRSFVGIPAVAGDNNRKLPPLLKSLTVNLSHSNSVRTSLSSPNTLAIKEAPAVRPPATFTRKSEHIFRSLYLFKHPVASPNDPVEKVPPKPFQVRSLGPSFRTQAEGYEEALRFKTKQLNSVVVAAEQHFMINPKKRLKVTWDLIIVMPLLVYLAFMIPFRLCFDNVPKLFSASYWFEFMIDMVFIFDIMISFRTGYFLNIDDSDIIEFHPKLVAVNYLKGWFVFDCLSGIPFALIELLFTADTSSANALKSIKTLRIIRFLKLGRLLKLEKIMANIDRDLIDRIEDFFSDIQTRSVIVVAVLALKMGYTVHLLSCLWVLVGRMGSLADDDNWLIHEMKGEFVAADTREGRNVRSIYIAAFYYTLTTMTSVGYGDIVTRNNTERAFTILLEFAGSFVYAMITAALTSVVTSMDLNVRKTAEQLDAVSSFVKTRRFPDDLGRRVRRHFRHFYSMKSAIDETKIFSELSTSLRKEVSAYLVSELMGDVELFRNMSPVLLPRLLPLLRPMRFETDEQVCEQGEQCSEMYVVIYGALHGSTKVRSDPQEFGPRVRRINAGDTVNILCALGIWNRCLESVQADVPVESYAITEKDFVDLFTAEADALTFEKLRVHEIHHYAVNPHFEGAPTKWGKPLYFCCFSAIDVTLVRGRDIPAVEGSGNPFAEIDIIDIDSGKQLSSLWHFKTSTSAKTVNPFWNEGTEWQDILAPFDRLALRVSIRDSEVNVADYFLGVCEIPLIELLALTTDKDSDLEESQSLPGLDENNTQGIDSSEAVPITKAMSKRQKDEKIEPLKPGYIQQWWNLTQPSKSKGVRKRGSMAQAIGSARILPSPGEKRQAFVTTSSKAAVQLRFRVRKADRDPLPSPSSNS